VFVVALVFVNVAAGAFVVKATILYQGLTFRSRPDPDRKLSADLYDIYYCCVYSEKLLMMVRRTVRNM